MVDVDVAVMVIGIAMAINVYQSGKQTSLPVFDNSSTTFNKSFSWLYHNLLDNLIFVLLFYTISHVPPRHHERDETGPVVYVHKALSTSLGIS